MVGRGMSPKQGVSFCFKNDMFMGSSWGCVCAASIHAFLRLLILADNCNGCVLCDGTRPHHFLARSLCIGLQQHASARIVDGHLLSPGVAGEHKEEACMVQAEEQ